MTSKLLRLGEKLKSIQRAAKPECQHPPGALAAAAAASPDQHATAIRGCAGERAGASGRAGEHLGEEGTGCSRAQRWPGTGVVQGPNLLTDDSVFLFHPGSSPLDGAEKKIGNRETGEGEEGRASGAQRRSEARTGAPGEAGARPASAGGAGWSRKDPGPRRPEGSRDAGLVWLIDRCSRREGDLLCQRPG